MPASILGSGGNCENTNKVPQLMARQVIIKLAIKHNNICKVALLRKHNVQLLSLFIIFRTQQALEDWRRCRSTTASSSPSVVVRYPTSKSGQISSGSGMAALRKRSGFLGDGLGKFWRRRNTRGGGSLVPGDGAGRARNAPAHSELSPEEPQSWVRQGSVSVVSDPPLPRARCRWTAPRAGTSAGHF